MPPVEPNPSPPAAAPTSVPAAQPGPVVDSAPVEPASRDRGRPSEADLRAEAAAERVQRRQVQEALHAREAELATAREEADRRESAARAEGNARAERFRARFVDAELRAHASVAGIVDLDLIPLIDRSAVAVDDDGNVTGVEAAVAAFRTAKPSFFRQASADVAPTPAAPPAPVTPTGSPRATPAPEPNPAPTNVRTLDRKDYDRTKREAIAALRGRY
jgi:hypothetical protein